MLATSESKDATEIRFLSSTQINALKWNRCVDQDASRLPYAYSWYLDTVADRWAGIVWGDYRAILPLPYNRKLLGLRQIYQPILTQQLGVFGHDLSASEMKNMLAAIPQVFRRVVTNLNAHNYRLLGEQPTLRRRTNLCLSLERPYQDLRAAYGKSLRKRLRKANQQLDFSTTTTNTDTDQLIELYREQIGDRLSWPERNYRIVAQLIKAAIQRQKGFVATVSNPDGTIVARGFFLHNRGQIINLFGASTEEGKAQFGMHFMLDRVIHSYAETANIFDFEGSEIPGVADFFRSFGASEEYYATYRRPDRFPWPIKKIIALREN